MTELYLIYLEKMDYIESGRADENAFGAGQFLF